MAQAPTGARPPAPAPPLPPELPPTGRQNAVVADVERTSLAGRNNAPDEVTLHFTRWHATGMSAYQKGQFAGFKRPEAQRLIAQGVAVLAETSQQQRDAADRFMVTK